MLIESDVYTSGFKVWGLGFMGLDATNQGF